MFSNLTDEKKKQLFINSINKGDVLLNDFKEANHKKFFIVAGKSIDNIFLCSVFINSNINPTLLNKLHLFNLQVPILKANNTFLKYDSFANCAYPIISDIENIYRDYTNKSCKVIGTIFKDDLILIQNSLINSNLLSEDEIETFLR